MRREAAIVAFLLSVPSVVWAQQAYNKEELKRDYRAFLQQLKALNAEYKEITGEMGQVMKEEGVPTWDMGEGLDIGEPKQELRDLGAGANLRETKKEMVLTLDLPGYRKDSIQIRFKDGKTLAVKAQRKLENVDRSFERSFDLPAPGDPKGSSATYEDGVLTVKIAKVASQEVTIPIR